MKSDLYFERVEIKEDFEDNIKTIAKLQASRDNPRKLVSVIRYDEELVLIFELV